MNMCAASLKNIGPCLISHCLCEWFIRKKVSPEFILQLSGDDPKSDCKNTYQIIIMVTLYGCIHTRYNGHSLWVYIYQPDK